MTTVIRNGTIVTADLMTCKAEVDVLLHAVLEMEGVVR